MSGTAADKKVLKGADTPERGTASTSGSILKGTLAGVLQQARPLRVPLDLITEDQDQPRSGKNPGFSAEKIAEIGATIKSRGVKSPISVKDDPRKPGHYIINDGARRYRGSRWAGVPDIPIFVDNDYVQDDQVVANIQNEGHTPRELAELIQKRLSTGMKKGDIAKAWGKSNAFITQYAALLKLPEVIANAFDADRITDVTVVNELVTAYKKHPEAVANWLSDESQEITRGSVKLLREFLEDSDGGDASLNEADADEPGTGGWGGDSPEEDQSGTQPLDVAKRGESTHIRKAGIQVEIDGGLCRVILTRRPSKVGMAWFKNESSGKEFEAALEIARMVALVEG